MSFNLLSKTKYLSGLQCPRLVWTEIHEPEKIPEADPVTQQMFDQGHLVGDLAKGLFADGIDIPTENFMESIYRTMDLLKERKPLFEAGILSDRLYSRVDILNPSGEERWDIIEVKSSTSPKAVHIDDVAYQRHCCKLYGLNIRKCFLALINNMFYINRVRDDIDVHTLYGIVPIDKEGETGPPTCNRLVAVYVPGDGVRGHAAYIGVNPWTFDHDKFKTLIRSLLELFGEHPKES